LGEGDTHFIEYDETAEGGSIDEELWNMLREMTSLVNLRRGAVAVSRLT